MLFRSKPPDSLFVYVFFRLVGVLPNFVPGTDCLALKTCRSFGGHGDEYGYLSTFNGTAGGDVLLAEGPGVDPGSGSIAGVSVSRLSCHPGQPGGSFAHGVNAGCRGRSFSRNKFARFVYGD